MKSAVGAGRPLTLSLSINGSAQTGAGLHGVITDPPARPFRAPWCNCAGPASTNAPTTDALGKYAIEGVKPGKYTVRFIAKGFTLIERKDVDIAKPMALDVQLVIAAENQVVNVEAEANTVSADTAENGDALVLEKSNWRYCPTIPTSFRSNCRRWPVPAAARMARRSTSMASPA